MPLVSVIIPCYNHSKYVKEAIDSVLQSTYEKIEIVVVNDASTDASADVIEQIARQHTSIIFLNQKQNKGLVASRNLAIKHAKGTYILPLDADDKIEPTYIEKAVKILSQNDQNSREGRIGMVYCEAAFFGDKSGKWNLSEYNQSKILYENCIFCTALFRKSDWERVGGYKEYMNKGWEDYDLWLSFIELGLKPYQIKETLFFYRKHGNSMITETVKHYEKLQIELIRHHINLYLNDDEFLSRIFKPDLSERFKKIKKFKKLFNISFTFIIIQFLIIALLIYNLGFSLL